MTSKKPDLFDALDLLLEPQAEWNPDTDPEWQDALAQTRDLDAQSKLAWIPRMFGSASSQQAEPGFASWMYVRDLARAEIDQFVALVMRDPALADSAQRADALYVLAESNLRVVVDRAGFSDYFWSIVATCSECGHDVVVGGLNRFVVWSVVSYRNRRAGPMIRPRCQIASWRVFRAAIEVERVRSEFRRALGITAESSRKPVITKELHDEVMTYAWLLVVVVASGIGLAASWW